jgi:hypothetical protein
MADLVDMKRTAADKAAEKAKWDGSPAEQDYYPYGLSICLDDAALTKLGVKASDFEMGSPVTLQASCDVTECSERTVNGKVTRSMTLQLQKIALTQDGGETVADTLYGK